MPELRFDDIGRGSLSYRTQFDGEESGMGRNPFLPLAGFLGAQLLRQGGKIGTKLWEKTSAKAIKDLKAGWFGKGTKNAAQAQKAIEEDALKAGENGAGKTLETEGIRGKAIEGGAVEKAATGAEKLGVKEGEKIGAELLVKEVEKGLAKGLGKRIPGVALAIGGYFAFDRWSKGDGEGAGDELKSATATTVPLIGTGASAIMDASLAARDKFREQMAGAGINPNRKLSPSGAVLSSMVAGVLGPAGGLIESSTRTFVSALEGFSEKGGFQKKAQELAQEKLSPFTEGALALEKKITGEAVAQATRPLAALAENLMGLHPQSGPAPGLPQRQQEEKRPQNTLDSQAPERAALQTEGTYEETKTRLQMPETGGGKTSGLERAAAEGLEAANEHAPKPGSSLLTRIQSTRPSSNLGAYLPASLSGADWGGVKTARAVGKEQQAVERFKKSLNVAPLSAQFKNALRSPERAKGQGLAHLEQPEARQSVEA